MVQLADTNVIEPSEPRVATEVGLFGSVRDLESLAVNVAVVPAAGHGFCRSLGAILMSPDLGWNVNWLCSPVTCRAAHDLARAIAEAFMLLITPFFC